MIKKVFLSIYLLSIFIFAQTNFSLQSRVLKIQENGLFQLKVMI